ncbi:hypothetical protein HU200_066192 [Digitaria exilis]|uniref:Uncharacterized protein n=1 Tax=Digitaria exilis TaxID=1010633 RepID=A0A835DU58_9POAL|nr:hypothetical protein HU200_066192 [Digitaria exilis]
MAAKMFALFALLALCASARYCYRYLSPMAVDIGSFAMSPCMQYCMTQHPLAMNPCMQYCMKATIFCMGSFASQTSMMLQQPVGLAASAVLDSDGDAISTMPLWCHIAGYTNNPLCSTRCLVASTYVLPAAPGWCFILDTYPYDVTDNNRVTCHRV